MKFGALTLIGFLISPARAELARCTRVIDGDTIVITATDGSTDRVRLAAIDAPERRQPGGPAAKAFLEKLILTKTIRLEGTRRDRYRRRLAHIYVGRKWVQLALVKSGHAHRMEKYSTDPRLSFFHPSSFIIHPSNRRSSE